MDIAAGLLKGPVKHETDEPEPDVVHEDGRYDFAHVPLRPQEPGYGSPDAASDEGGYEHRRQENGSGQACEGEGQPAPRRAPMCNCPSPPILKSPQRKAKATPRPAKRRGTVFCKVRPKAVKAAEVHFKECRVGIHGLIPATAMRKPPEAMLPALPIPEPERERPRELSQTSCASWGVSHLVVLFRPDASHQQADLSDICFLGIPYPQDLASEHHGDSVAQGKYLL